MIAEGALKSTSMSQIHGGDGLAKSFVQLHGTGTQQIIRRIPRVDERYMNDGALLDLYGSREAEQVMGAGVGELMKRVPLGAHRSVVYVEPHATQRQDLRMSRVIETFLKAAFPAHQPL